MSTADGWGRVLPGLVGAAVLLVLRHLLSGRDESWSDLVAVAAFTAVALGVTLVVVPLALRTEPRTAATAAVVLGVLAVPVLVVFFFSGAPFVLGFAAWFLSRTEHVRSVGGARPRVAMVLGLLVVVLSLLANLGLAVTHLHPGLPRG